MKKASPGEIQDGVALVLQLFSTVLEWAWYLADCWIEGGAGFVIKD